MKKILLFTFLIGFSLAGFGQALYNHTGTGWRPDYVKKDFRDSTFFAKQAAFYSDVLINGSLGTTASRVLKGWFISLESTNRPTFNGTGLMAYSDSAAIVARYARLMSPAFIGVPTAPTAAPGTNTTQIATTAFVLANSGTGSGTVTSVATGLGLTGGTITTTGTLAVDTSHSQILSRLRASHEYQPKGSYGTGTVTSIATGLGLSGGTITSTGTLLVDTSHAQILSRLRASHEYQAKGTYASGSGSASGTNTGDNATNTQYSGLVTFPGFGTSGSTAAVGNDARLSDARTPTAHNQAQSTITALSDSLLARYTKTQTGLLFAPLSHTQAVSTISDATTIGQNFVKLTNPSAITFPRINANNTLDALSASDFRTAIGAGVGGGDMSKSDSASTGGAPGKYTPAHRAVVIETAVALNTAKVTNATHTNDATGSGALTVVALNGTNLAGLATGVLQNTTGTGIPSIAAEEAFTTESLAVYAVMKLPDTTSYTNNFTLQLSDAHKWISVVGATSIAVTIPNNSIAIPVGTTINFVQGGAGIIVFKAASGVTKTAFKDSTATDGIWSWAALYKRGATNWCLYGNIGQ